MDEKIDVWHSAEPEMSFPPFNPRLYVNPSFLSFAVDVAKRASDEKRFKRMNSAVDSKREAYLVSYSACVKSLDASTVASRPTFSNMATNHQTGSFDVRSHITRNYA